MKKGLFITFEGGDGSGKSTQIRLLSDHLQGKGYQVLLTREPGGTAISEKIRNILLDTDNKEMDPVTECMLYAAARAQLVAELIRPAIEDGKIVICDRFIDSSLAYQAYGRQLGGMVMDINRYAIGQYMPDLTVYLRVDPQTGRARISGRSQDRIESEPDAFHQRVFQGYEDISRKEEERILTIDASGTIEDIAAQIREAVTQRIQKNQL